MLQSFQTCTLIRFQIKKPLIFVQSVSHAFVSMVTICEITCSISCFPVKLNRSLFQNFMERNRKKYKQDFDAIKPELRGYKYMKGIIRSYIISTVYFFLHKQTEKDKCKHLVRCRFLQEKLIKLSWKLFTIFQRWETESLFHQTHSL